MAKSKSPQYWTDRFETLQDAQLKKADKVAKDLEKSYKRAMASVERDILTWYQRFADNNQIDLAEAQQLLKAGELKEFKWTVEDYIKYGRANSFDPRYLKELENASARVHIRRLEVLQLQIRHQVEALHTKRFQDLLTLSSDIYSERYYRTAYETQLGFNIGWNIDRLDLDAVATMIRKPWAPDGLDFSSRIWRDRTKMVNTLYNELMQAIIRGDGPRELISTMANTFNVSKNTAGRLVMTESAFFSSVAQRDAFKELDVVQYQYVATLDLKTSDICQEMDREIFMIEQYQVGVTAPPLHSWCRSTTIPYFADNYGERAARGEDGKTYYVPSDMKYEEWKNTFVGNENYDKIREQQKNTAYDKTQFKRYQDVLGEYGPKSFEDFKDIKYNKSEEWVALKNDYRAMNHYSKVASREPAITAELMDISKLTDTVLVGLEFRLKSKESFFRKFREEMRTVNQLDYVLDESKDIIRYTYQDSADNIVGKYLRIKEILSEKGYNTIKVKNYWLDKKSAYKGININYQDVDGVKFEVQYHTPESFDLKNGVLHKLYEEYRVLPDKSSKEAKALSARMKKLSSELIEPKNVGEVR